MATTGINDFLNKKYKELDFDGEWLASFGKPEKNFKCCVAGASGNGKTEFVIKLTKYLASFTKVYYNSHEQKFSKSLRDALQRNNMREVNGKVVFADGESVEEMDERLGKRNSPGAIVIDSRDYMKLTIDQFVFLINKYPHKCFIVICWASGSKPKGSHAEAIEYCCDVKILVKDFKAHMRSRFGGNKPFDIWPERNNKAKTPAKGEQSDLFSTTLSAEIPTIKA
ncbi:hypothetical protein [Mucilaginibacter sp.]|uniref:hypothetical protein n=1 Tax=Mucilaginibacter sp. TaxID=1882438 RepID=UPI000CBB8BE5|nr:hypothetical protein [Mucilaginibacter sp.]PLW90008.1 MAG: hypothetical protein C0154_08780 [Mucilaginibacter sp.]PMP65802.1 MAG: hypothetical protein C0191_02770 [Mucilaginibacter sp.]